MLARLLSARGKHQASWLVQFKHLAARALRNTLRNPFPFLLHGVTAVRVLKHLSFQLTLLDMPELNVFSRLYCMRGLFYFFLSMGRSIVDLCFLYFFGVL